MKYGLDDAVIQKIQDVFAAFPQVDKAVLYGSRANGKYKPGSDIDITLKGANINLSVMNQIGLSLDDLLLPYTFDLSVFEHIKDPDLLEHIDRVGIVFYEQNLGEGKLRGD